MATLQYKIMSIPANNAEEQLNELAANGWRLHTGYPVASSTQETASIDWLTCILERQVVEEPEKPSPMGVN